MYNRMLEHSIEGIFTFSCAGRKTFLQEDIVKEVEQVGKIAPNVGFFSYSEFFGTNVCHTAMLNFSMVNLCLSESDTLPSMQKEDETAEVTDYLKYGLSNIAVSTSNELMTLNETLQDKIDESVKNIERTNLEHIEAYKKVIENMHNMAWMGSITTGKTIYANPRFIQVSGYSQSEILSKQIDEFYDEKTRLVINEHRKHRVKGKVTTYEGTMISSQ